MAKTKGGYVDGFVIPIPKKNVAAYKKMAREGAKIWKKFGALEYYECMGEDLKTKAGTGMPAPISFMKLAKAKPGEAVWFSFVVFKNRKHRDAVNKKVIAYFEKKYANEDMAMMPFDSRRMAYGGFTAEVTA